jgi:alpha-D-ribose 1-methylphosphonate 5-triphosphate synthase subunit PhnG
MATATDTNAPRQAWMSLLAKAPADRLAALWDSFADAPGYSLLRPPEIGSVMVRGRMGAVGAPFNLGETTITRCSIRLDSGEDGHAYVQGRDKDKALHAALIDGLMQTGAAARIEAAILTPLRTQRDATKARHAAKAAATKVEFFTLARGED